MSFRSFARTGASAALLLFGLAGCAQISEQNLVDPGLANIRYGISVLIASGPTEIADSAALSSLAWRTTPLDSALNNLASSASAATSNPVAISIPSLGITNATISAVGVEDNGEMEVPGPLDVGWYEYGVSPGQPGAAVLAAHVAYDGVDGVFVNLTDLQPGAEIIVEFESGDSQSFRVDRLDQYEKSELPDDELFSRTGESKLVLITCGGDFQSAVRSYSDNVVATASPV